MIKISDDYLAGFIEGEGMFYIGIVPSKETTSGWQVIYFFKVSQNPSGKIVLDYLKERLNCGYIKANSQTDLTDRSLAFVVRNYDDLINKVIPLFEGKLYIKKSNFEKLKQVLILVGQGEHLTKDGLSQIIDVAYTMNTRKRRFSKEYILRSYKT